MLRRSQIPATSAAPRRQQGVVLMIALIMLVSMTLMGIALVRSVDTTNIIAGNLAFKQSATSSGDLGTEAAITWLEANNTATTLHANIYAQGYAAQRSDPGVGQTWDSFWTGSMVPAGQVVTLGTDSAGNTVSYAIQRLCNAPGDPVNVGVDCAVPQTSGASAGSSKGAGVIALLFNSQIYYRITSRVVGPRNTVSYIQTVIAL